MAEGTSKTDIQKRNLCGPCLHDGDSKEAEGRCVECAEGLCSECYRVHTKPRPMRNRELQPIMDKLTIAPSQKQKCAIHTKEVISYFCKTHETLCCERCLNTSHLACRNASPLSELSEDLFVSADFKAFSARVAEIKQLNRDTVLKAERNEDIINDCFETCKDDFSALVVELKDTHLARLRSAKKDSTGLLEQARLWQDSITQAEKSNDSRQLFIMMKLIDKDLNLIEKNSSQIGTQLSIERYGFVACNEPGVLGKLVTIPYCVGKIAVNSKNDTDECSIRNMLLINEETMLLADYTNKCIKAINLKNKTVTARLTTTSKPWELTMTDNQRVVVSFYDSKTLMFLNSPANDINNMEETTYDECIRTVAYDMNSLLICCYDPVGSLQLYENGSKKSYKEIECSKKLLTSPFHSTFNTVNKSLIVTDNVNGTLTELSEDGDARLITDCDMIAWPEDVTVDNGGTYIVCSWGHKSVVRVHEGGQTDAMISGLDFKPESLALDRTDRLLYVAGICDSIYVYRI